MSNVEALKAEVKKLIGEKEGLEKQLNDKNELISKKQEELRDLVFEKFQEDAKTYGLKVSKPVPKGTRGRKAKSATEETPATAE